jgi:PelA/Pel-15E family pectate lyase
MRKKIALPVLLLGLGCAAVVPRAVAAEAPSRAAALETMKRATTFMVEKVSYKGGYVWSYLPDFSRQWGEMEARRTMIWMQAPGTSEMGELFLDAYHATGDEYYYQAAEQVAGAVIWGQLPCGGWNYIVDFAGERSLREWYDTVGKNGWRLEEFLHYYGNATFDDSVSSLAGQFLLRIYVEKRDPKFKPALDKAIQFVLDSQYPIGAWPQRYPLMYDFSHHGLADYTSYLTFNDAVISENIDFLLQCYQVLGEKRVLDPIIRGMNSFLVTQQGQPQPGWALQYTPDLKPAGARTYEPKAIVTHTTAANLNNLLQYYRLTGETTYLARIPEAIDWLESVRLGPDVPRNGRGDFPTFLEVGTNKPLYVHRTGSNVINGHYYVDYDPKNTIGHYSSFRSVDTAGLRQRYAEAKAMTPAEATKDSPLRPGAGLIDLPRIVTRAGGFFGGGRGGGAPGGNAGDRIGQLISGLNKDGYWPSPLRSTSHPYHGDGSKEVTPGDYSRTQVGDATDTSPYTSPDAVTGISTSGYMRNMATLIEFVDRASPAK